MKFINTDWNVTVMFVVVRIAPTGKRFIGLFKSYDDAKQIIGAMKINDADTPNVKYRIEDLNGNVIRWFF